MSDITPQAIEAAEHIVKAADLARQLDSTLDAATPTNVPVPWTSDVNQVRAAVQQLSGGGRWPAHATIETMARTLLQEAQAPSGQS